MLTRRAATCSGYPQMEVMIKGFSSRLNLSLHELNELLMCFTGQHPKRKANIRISIICVYFLMFVITLWTTGCQRLVPALHNSTAFSVNEH